jgi:hypothetical protein
MASADFCCLSPASRLGLPFPRLDNRPPQVRTLAFPAHLPHLLLRLLIASDFVVSCQLVQPHSLMWFVFLRSQVCFRLPPDITSRYCPCLPLAVGATSSARVFHPLVNAHAGRTLSRERRLAAPSHTTGHAGPHPAVRQTWRHRFCAGLSFVSCR